jgi:hypothetical protein
MEKEHIKKLISSLNKLNLRYAFTGAFAVSYYGFPRISIDIDILIEKNKSKLLRLVNLLHQNEYDITKTDVLKAIEECSHFPVFHQEKMFPYFDLKVACEKDERSSIHNCKIINYHGLKCRIVSVEDLILKKLEWNDTKDVEVVLIRCKEIDMKKLEKMSKQKSVYKKLQKLIEKRKTSL